MELEEFFADYLNEEDEKPLFEGPTQSFDLYFECLRHSSADIFPKNRPMLVEEFKNLPKLKKIFLEAFKKSTKETFETNFDQIYFKIGGRSKQYMKFYGSALLMVDEFKKGWDSVIPLTDSRPSNSEAKKRKAGVTFEDEEGLDAVSNKGYSRSGDDRRRAIFEEVDSEENWDSERTMDSEDKWDSEERNQEYKIRKTAKKVRFENETTFCNSPSSTFEDEIHKEPVEDCTPNALDMIDFYTRCPGIDEDHKVVNVDNTENALAALPYAFNLIPAPTVCASSDWVFQASRFKPRTVEEFRNIMMKFHYSEPIPRVRNLFIFDTLLKPLQTHTVVKHSAAIDLSFPTPFSVFFKALQEVRKLKKNAYIIPRIYIAYGMDLAIRAVDRECCFSELDSFINKFLKSLDEDFGPKSPARFKNAESEEPISPQYPNIYFVTIPYCKADGRGVIDFNDRFKKVNNFLNEFVKENNGSKGRFMEVIDWQKVVSEDGLSDVSQEMVDLRACKLHELLLKDQEEFLIQK